MDEFHVPSNVTIDPSRSLSDVLLESARAHPDKVVFEKQVAGRWQPRTAAQVLTEVEGVAKGLIAAGITPGDRVGIMSRTRYEWSIIDFAVWHAGAVPVPVYETSSADQTQWILADSGAVAVFVETADHAAIVEQARQENGGLDALTSVWTIEEGALNDLTVSGADVPAADLAARHTAVRADDLATIIYTSGTTGRPKGAELTHTNFVSLTEAAVTHIPEVFSQVGGRTLLFMPMAHVFARYVSVLAIIGRTALGHTPDVKQLVADMATFRPTYILSVPRVFEKVYNASEQKAAAGGKVKIFRWAAKVGISYSRALDTPAGPGIRLTLLHKVADALVLKKIRAALGGQAKYAVSGGAPLGERLTHFFRAAGLIVLEGYGLTETTAPSNVNVPGKVKVGTVGPPIPGTALKIDSDGEILVSGIGVFRGYHNNQEATEAAFEGEWFRTGDLGSLDEDGYLTITGRKKEILVTAGGKNVAPTQIEDPLRAHPLISQVVVVGDQKPFVAALISLDEEMLPSWLENHGLPELSVAEAKEDDTVLRHLQMAVDRTNQKVSRAESVRKFHILDHDLTIANGYLTPSLKVKRGEVVKDFADAIEKLYADAAEARQRNGG